MLRFPYQGAARFVCGYEGVESDPVSERSIDRPARSPVIDDIDALDNGDEMLEVTEVGPVIEHLLRGRINR